MKFITFSGPPSSGKTSVILKAMEELKDKHFKIGVLKFDCLVTDDDKLYAAQNIDSRVGISGSMCPDHFFVSNIDDCLNWGIRHSYDILISESAGLCNRCSPHIKGCTAVCVIDNLMGINTPKKIGPMLKMADIIVITKGDIVSQAEREIFALKIRQANPDGIILHVNGITGQGASELAVLIENATQVETLKGKELRISMPSALCSYCLGETQIGMDKQKGNIRKMKLD
ncbi:Ni2+-binding GTPase involved in regulation of expression and maturation of urease and hydrogenase [Anaerovirgula multivorans]|uniref:Ni2+-binding GTPase involved in regulation of expression and maturation of urease and hydrogenase n=1 Tax=Anaerovirgula multivorans TaxID=312168 RepID=A0A239CG98_9FIRM|nr:GTP-binding protein [Anaerovirgula multivorans]SNS19120.1 Ni2+-binding GTPase involved in regulation of expression and maturation of urease and hydrogenase [Anaerovirgula multivorans]